MQVPDLEVSTACVCMESVLTSNYPCLLFYGRNSTFQPVERDKVQTTYNYLDLGVGLGQLTLLLV